MSDEPKQPSPPPATPPPRDNLLKAHDLWDAGKTWFSRGMAFSSAIGMLIVVTYFLRIRYLPIDSLSSVASLGAVVALLACAILAAYAILLGAPTFLITIAKSFDFLWQAISPISRTGQNEVAAPNQEPKASGARALSFVFTSIGLLWLYLLFKNTPGFVVPSENQDAAVLLTGLGWFSSLIFYAFRMNSSNYEGSPTHGWSYCKDVLTRCGWFLTFSFSGAYPILGYFVMADLSSIEGSGWLHELIFVLFGLSAITVLNGINLYVELNKTSGGSTPTWGIQAGIAASIVVILLVALGATSKFHDGLMQAVSVRVSKAHLVINKPTCDALRQAGIAVSNYAPLPGESKPEQCILLGVTILSRLGAQWRIACAPDSTDRGDYRGFNIDAKDVVITLDSTSRIKPDPDTAKLNNACMGMWSP